MSKNGVNCEIISMVWYEEGIFSMYEWNILYKYVMWFISLAPEIFHFVFVYMVCVLVEEMDWSH